MGCPYCSQGSQRKRCALILSENLIIGNVEQMQYQDIIDKYYQMIDTYDSQEVGLSHSPNPQTLQGQGNTKLPETPNMMRLKRGSIEMQITESCDASPNKDASGLLEDTG